MDTGAQGFIIFWLSSAVLCGWWSYAKGNSFILGFLASVFLTPFVGLLIALFTKKNEKVLEERAIKAGKQKKCPKCAEIVRPEATKCKHCGADI